MRILPILFLLILAALPARAQDVLKMLDGTQVEVKFIGVQGDKVLYYEMGDPLALEHDIPKSRVLKVVHGDGYVEDLRKTYEDKPGEVVTREVKIDSATARPVTGQSLRANGRRYFALDDAAGPDAYLQRHPVAQAAGSLGRLYTLDEVLDFRGFTSMADALASAADVRVLDLRGQGLKAVPKEVLNLKRLVGLNLSGNPISTFPSELLAMPSLQYLWLDSCQLTELKPAFDSKNHSNLIYLSAQGNRIGEVDAAVGALPSLYVLRLHGNRIHRVRGKALLAAGQPSTLAVVDLSQNGLEELPTGLAAFPQMRYLGCRDNQIATATAAEGDLSHVSDLDLGRNPLSKLDPALITLPRLRALRLDDTKLTALPPHGWAQARNLEELALPATAGPIPAEVWMAPKLARFSMAGVPPMNTAPAPLPTATPDSLLFADVTATPGSAALALSLKARRPQARLRYFSALMGKAQECAPGAVPELILLADARNGASDPALKLSQALVKRGDYGLALAALAAGSNADTASADRLRLEQARILMMPAVQAHVDSEMALREYTSFADYKAHFHTCVSANMLRRLCAHIRGQAAHPACGELSAILRKTATNLYNMDDAAAKEEGARLQKEAAAIDKKK